MSVMFLLRMRSAVGSPSSRAAHTKVCISMLDWMSTFVSNRNTNSLNCFVFALFCSPFCSTLNYHSEIGSNQGVFSYDWILRTVALCTLANVTLQDLSIWCRYILMY